MNAITLLREQLKSAHQTQEKTIGEVTNDQLNFNETGKALPAGAAYAHSVLAEDMIVSTSLAMKEPLAKNSTDIGVSEMMPWMSEWDKHENWVKTVQIDLPKFGEFAKKVYQATDDYLATLTDEDLDVETDVPMMGKSTLAYRISNLLILHIANLTGEISAAKGIQGLKGYPF